MVLPSGKPAKVVVIGWVLVRMTTDLELVEAGAGGVAVELDGVAALGLEGDRGSPELDYTGAGPDVAAQRQAAAVGVEVGAQQQGGVVEGEAAAVAAGADGDRAGDRDGVGGLEVNGRAGIERVLEEVRGKAKRMLSGR